MLVDGVEEGGAACAQQTVGSETKRIAPARILILWLKEPPFRPPDWFSLLVFMLLRIRDLLDDPRLTIGYRHPGGWSRMVTLNYSEDPLHPDTTVAAAGRYKIDR